MCDGVEGPTQACAEGLVANAPSQDAASAGGVEIVTAVTEGGEPAVAAATAGEVEEEGAKRGGVELVTAVTEGEAGEEGRRGVPARVTNESHADFRYVGHAAPDCYC